MKKFYRVLFGVGLLVLAGCCRFPSRTSSEVQLRYTTEQKLWGLAASAVLTFRNEHDFFSLTGVIAGEPGKKEVQGALNGWDVESREDLLAVMKKVSEKGHRASYRAIKADLKRPPGERVWPSKDVSRVAFVQQHAEQLGDNALVGWDLSRLISLARWGVASGYLEENEAWEWIMPAAQEIQRTYSSWEDLGQSYLNGRRFWSAYHTRKDGYKYQRAVFWLLSNEHSPWKQLDWNLDLTGTHDLCADESVVPDTEGYYQVVRYYAQVDQYPILLSEVIKDPEESELSRGNAFNKLGDYYQYDWCGVGKNIRQAAEYYKEGAELGNAGCLYNLGRLHLFGTDCPKDYDQALMFFTRAEEQGSVRAILELGRLYEYGKGVEKDIDKALSIYREAMRCGALFAEHDIVRLMLDNPDFWNADEAVRLAYAAGYKSECHAHYNILVRALIKTAHWPEAWNVLDEWERYSRHEIESYDSSKRAEEIETYRDAVKEFWVPLTESVASAVP